MAAVEQQAVVVEEHEEEQEEFQARSPGPLPWPVSACAAGGLPEGSTCERGSPMPAVDRPAAASSLRCAAFGQAGGAH